jgi:hypothetical protein
VVLALGDLHSVRVAHAEPALGDPGDLLATTFDGELVVEQAAFDGQVIGSWNIDGELLPERGEQALAYLGGLLATDGDLVRRSQ